jgi:hypothetical protein
MWISFILSFLNSQMQILKYGICCTQIARHQKTAQESEVTCKNKEPLFRLKLGLSNLTDTAGSAQSPEPHPGRVFIGEGQEAGLPTLGVNRLDVIQVRGSWHIGIGFYSIVSWSSGVWPELFLFLVTLGKGLLCSIMIGSGLRWCIPEEGSCPGYGAFQGRGCAQVSAKEQRSLSLK